MPRPRKAIRPVEKNISLPEGKAIVFAKCRVADGQVTIINPCKPWKGK